MEPQAAMLYSLINTALRDGETIEDVCAAHGWTREELDARLAALGLVFCDKTGRVTEK